MNWAITHVSPIGGSVLGDVLLTLTGQGFDQLSRVEYDPRKTVAPLWAISATQAQTYLPCSKMGVGVHTLMVRTSSGDVLPVGSGSGMRLVCHTSVQSDGVVPFAGPSWPNTVSTCTAPQLAVRTACTYLPPAYLPPCVPCVPAYRAYLRRRASVRTTSMIPRVRPQTKGSHAFDRQARDDSGPHLVRRADQQLLHGSKQLL